MFILKQVKNQHLWPKSFILRKVHITAPFNIKLKAMELIMDFYLTKIYHSLHYRLWFCQTCLIQNLLTKFKENSLKISMKR